MLGTKVKVLSGKDKKKEGEVIEINRSTNRVKVKDINMVKKHIKTTKEKKGGIVSKENFIHFSNLIYIDKKNEVTASIKPTLQGYIFENVLDKQIISFA